MAHENATPRPWRVSVGIDNGLPCVDATNSLGEIIEVCEVWGVLADKVEDEGSQANAALIVEAVNAYDTLRAENERLKKEIKRLGRLATDNAYMRDAYHAMLMPTGLKVAEMWKKQGVLRQHTSWGDNAWLLTGEERAQCILDWEAEPRREMLPGEIDGILSPEAQS